MAAVVTPIVVVGVAMVPWWHAGRDGAGTRGVVAMGQFETRLYVVVLSENVAYPPYFKVTGKHVHYREDVARAQMERFNSMDTHTHAHMETETVVARVWHVMCGTCGQEVDAMTREGADNSHDDGAHYPSWYLEGDADRRMSNIVEGW